MSHLAIERALILLLYVVDNPEGLSIRQFSREFGYAPASVQKIISALKDQGFVVQDEMTDRYHLGPKAVQLGLVALNRLDVRKIARPLMENLCERSGETVFLGVANDNHAIYVDKVISTQPIRMDALSGVDRPYNCTAVGKILLSGMPSDAIYNLSEKGLLEERTENSIREVEELIAEVEKIREQGWALDDEEFTPGAVCVAAPIRDHDGLIIASLAIAGPSDRMRENLKDRIEEVKASAYEVSERLGFSERFVSFHTSDATRV